MSNAKQTALQKLKEKLETQKEFYGIRFTQFILWIDELMEYDKQQIKDAYNQGYRDGETDSQSMSNEKDVAFYENAENYYNDKFKI